MAKVYFSTETEKLKPYIQNFEKASVGDTVRDTVIKVLAYANILHSKHFGVSYQNE